MKPTPRYRKGIPSKCIACIKEMFGFAGCPFNAKQRAKPGACSEYKRFK